MTGWHRLRAIDLSACRAWRTLPHSPRVDRALGELSRATDHAVGWISLGAIGAVCDRDRRSAWTAATMTVIAAEHASVLGKRATRRARPNLRELPPLASTPSPLSFPSSHTASAVAAAWAFGALVPAAPLWTLAAVTALSRPYLGVHYPSDVAAGAALGHALGRVGRGIVNSLLAGPSATRAG